MAYVPKDWVTGEVITEQALDHIEQGIAGLNAILTITKTEEEIDGVATTVVHLGKSYNDIMAMLNNGVVPFINAPSGNDTAGKSSIWHLLSIEHATDGGEDFYEVGFGIASTNTVSYFGASTATDELANLDNDIG